MDNFYKICVQNIDRPYQKVFLPIFLYTTLPEQSIPSYLCPLHKQAEVRANFRLH